MSKRKTKRETKPRRKHEKDSTALEESISFARDVLSEEAGEPAAVLILSTTFGDDGVLRYASNMDRSDAINLLKEWLLKCGAAEDWMNHIK